jgi:hypothetical protein
VPLVPAFAPCTNPDRQHGPPLAFGSCAAPQPTSGQLTVGTPDANGAGANSSGFVKYAVVVGDPNTPANEADVVVEVSMSDVRKQGDLSDYTGQLRVDPGVRMTDRYNGSSNNEPATVVDIPFPIDVQCAATASPSVGSTCAVNTSFNAVAPSSVVDSRRARAVLQLGAVSVFDGGPDGVASTTPNTLFARQGVFVP